MRKIGILGGGNISDSHLRAALEIDGLEVAAVCGQNREKVEELARSCGATPYSRLEAFLEHEGLELVAIGSPSGLHAEQGIAAARRGLHVVVEKPIDITVERADRFIEECDRAGVKLGVFFQDRVAPDLVRVKEMIGTGEFGKLILVTGHVKWYRPPEYYGDSKWRGTWALDGGGAIMNQGIHTVDLLLHLAGKAKRVFGFTRTLLHDIETEDTAVASIEFENGAVGTFEASTSAYPGQPRRVYVTGTEGTVFIEHDRIVSAELHGRSEVGAQAEEDRNLSESSAVVSDVSGHRRILEDFLRAIAEDRPPLCDGREGRRSVELVRAIYRSAASNTPVEF